MNQRIMSNVKLSLICVCSALTVLSCKDPEKKETKLSSINISPDISTISTISGSNKQQYHATGKYSDKTTGDITSSMPYKLGTGLEWKSTNQSVATISASGEATGLSPGNTEITATIYYFGIAGLSSNSVTLTVK